MTLLISCKILRRLTFAKVMIGTLKSTSENWTHRAFFATWSKYANSRELGFNVAKRYITFAKAKQIVPQGAGINPWTCLFVNRYGSWRKIIYVKFKSLNPLGFVLYLNGVRIKFWTRWEQNITFSIVLFPLVPWMFVFFRELNFFLNSSASQPDLRIKK